MSEERDRAFVHNVAAGAGAVIYESGAITFRNYKEVLMAFPSLRAALYAASPAPVSRAGWIAVSESLPEYGEDVLLYRPDAHRSHDPHFLISKRIKTSEGPFEFRCVAEPTHWMRLSAPLNSGAEEAPVSRAEPIYQWRGRSAGAWWDCPKAQYEYVGQGSAGAKPGTYGASWQRRIVYAAQSAPLNAEPTEEVLTEAAARALSGLYGCSRVWSAWSVGTMGEDDFYAADENDECIEQVVGEMRALFVRPLALTAKQRYDECMREGEEPSPIERLRFFCSLAMDGQDWLDVEPFFGAVLASQPSEDKRDAERYRWLRSRPSGPEAPLIADGIYFSIAVQDAVKSWVIESVRNEAMDAAIDGVIYKGEGVQNSGVK